MPTKTEQYLEILARGGDAPTSCCMTNEQRLIAEAIDRINNIGGGGGGAVVLSTVADSVSQTRVWSFKDSNEAFSYDNLLAHLANGETPVIYIDELGTYQAVDYWAEKTLDDDSKVIDMMIDECYGVGHIATWHQLSSVDATVSSQAPEMAHVVVAEDGSVSVDKMGILNQVLEVDVSSSEYYFNFNGSILVNGEPGYVDFYDDQAFAGAVLVKLIDKSMSVMVRNYDDGNKIKYNATSAGVVRVQKNGVNVDRAIITWEGIDNNNSITYDPDTGEPILSRYKGVFTVDADDGSFTYNTTPIQYIANGEDMNF